MLIGEKTTAPQILEGWGWRGAGRWRSGEEEPCTCSPPTLLLLLPSPPLVPSPELFNSPFLPFFPSPSSSLFRGLGYLLRR